MGGKARPKVYEVRWPASPDVVFAQPTSRTHAVHLVESYAALEDELGRRLARYGVPLDLSKWESVAIYLCAENDTPIYYEILYETVVVEGQYYVNDVTRGGVAYLSASDDPFICIFDGAVYTTSVVVADKVRAEERSVAEFFEKRASESRSKQVIQSDNRRRLEKLVLQDPQRAWDDICSLFDGWTGDDVDDAIAFANRSMANWPASVRSAPMPWYTDSIYNEPTSREDYEYGQRWSYRGLRKDVPNAWKIVRSIFVEVSSLPEEDFCALVCSPRFAEIEELTIQGTLYGPDGFVALRESHFSGNLRALTTILWSYQGDTLEAFTALPVLAQLRKLSIQHGIDSAEDLRAVLSAQGLENLSELELRDNGFGPEGAHVFAELDHYTRLRALSLCKNGIGPDGAIALARAPVLAGLQTLVVEDGGWDPGDIEARGAIALVSSPLLANLRELRFRYGGIGDEGASALAQSPHMSNLEVLELSVQGISSRGAAAIAASPYLDTLRELVLSHNAVDDEGAQALASSPTLSRLESLSLDENKIGESGRKTLARSPYLADSVRTAFRD